MIHRRWPDTLILAAAGLGLLAWAASLFHSTFFGGALAGLFGLALLAIAVLGPASGTCPMCGKALHGLFALALVEYERCPHCRGYFRLSDGREVPADHAAKTPQFAVPIGEGERLPDLCCACGAPATRTREVAYRSEGRISHVSPQVLKTDIKVSAPFCAAHDGGVAIVSEDFAPTVPLLESLNSPQRSDHRWVLKVRSYAFYRAAVFG